MPFFSAGTPPQLRAAFGDLTYTPQVEIWNVATATSIVLTSTNMIRLVGTPIWYFNVGSNMVLPASLTAFVYIIKDNEGRTKEEGSFDIASLTIADIGDGPTQITVDVAKAFEKPSSVTLTKKYKVIVQGTTLTGISFAFDSVDISFTFSDPANSAFNIASTPMIFDSGTKTYSYEFIVTYLTPKDFIDIEVEMVVGETARHRKFTTEVITRSEFNLQRLPQNIIIN